MNRRGLGGTAVQGCQHEDGGSVAWEVNRANADAYCQPSCLGLGENCEAGRGPDGQRELLSDGVDLVRADLGVRDVEDKVERAVAGGCEAEQLVIESHLDC